MQVAIDALKHIPPEHQASLSILGHNSRACRDVTQHEQQQQQSAVDAFKHYASKHQAPPLRF
jgi:hypothetical protein